MNVVLEFVRPKRKPAAFAPDSNAAIKRNLIWAGIDKARAAGDSNHVGHLQTILTTASYPAAAWRRLCPCGCGRAPGQHNPMNDGGEAA